MKKVLSVNFLVIVIFVLFFVISVDVHTKADNLKYLDIELDTLSASGKLYRKESVPDEIKAINRIYNKYNKLSSAEKCIVFLNGFFQASLQNRKLLNKLCDDFSLDRIPDKKYKHKYFNFKKTEVLTTEDFKMYKKLFKWSPKGKLTPYCIDLNFYNIYFIDESRNFAYVAKFTINEKTGKIDIISFFSEYYPLTPYIFFAGYMGYPDIPEASPDYK